MVLRVFVTFLEGFLRTPGLTVLARLAAEDLASLCTEFGRGAP